MTKITSDNWWHFGSKVIVRCPDCDGTASLEHDVAADGTIDPSLDCPSCEFHDHAWLESWSPQGWEKTAQS